MSRRRGALRSFLASISARALRAVARVGVLLLAARLYDISDVGEFAFVLGTGTLIVGALDFGVTLFVQREVGAHGFASAHLEHDAWHVRLLSLPAAFLLSWGISWLLVPDLGFGALGTLLFATALGTTDFLTALRRAHGEFEREAWELSPVLVGGVGAGLVTGLTGSGFQAFQWALGIGAAVGMAVRLPSLHGRLKQDGQASSGGAASMIWRCRWFWLSMIGVLTLFELPTVLLRALADAQSVALFASAMRAVGLASQPLLVLGGLFIPSLAYQNRDDRVGFLSSARHANGILLAAVPAGVALAVVGGAILLRGFGNEYSAAMSAVWVLGFGICLYVGPPYAGTLLVDGLERGLALLAVVTAGVAAVLCLVLVPDYGATGAAWAVTGGFVVAKAGHIVLYVRQRLPLYSPGAWIGAAWLAVWMVAAYLSPAAIRWGLVALGGFVGLGLAYRLLKETSLFPTRAEQQSGLEDALR